MTNWKNIGKVDIDMKHFFIKENYFKNIKLFIKFIKFNYY